MKSLFEYLIVEGHKQKVTNWKKFAAEGRQKYGHNTPEYFKYLTDFLIEEILWKYPIEFQEIKSEDVKMGYSGIPAQKHSICYKYNNHTIKFIFNSFFNEPFLYIKIDDVDKTYDVCGEWHDMPISWLLTDKNRISEFMSIIDEYGNK